MINHIVACSDNNVIGIDGDLPWYLPEDLKRFKKLTDGCSIIMGRTTYESIGKALPNRINIVVTRQEDYNAEGCLVVGSIREAIACALTCKEVFIIGGSTIYQQTMGIIDRIYFTRVHRTIEDGDAFYPDLPNDFKETDREECGTHTNITYRKTYEKAKSDS